MDNSQQNLGDDTTTTELGGGVEIISDSEDVLDDVEYESYNDDISPMSKSTPQEKITKLKEKLIDTERSKQEYLDGWQRLKADYINLKKRCDEEKSDLGKYAKESFVSDLIPVIESFDMAFANKEAWEKVDPTWRIGVEYIHKQFMETLGNYGLKEVNPIGEIFDPSHFTAIENVATNDKLSEHKVAEVVQKGYKVGDRLIKSPKVKVFVFNQEVNN
jgi:molecular chaperone GrpE